jgi:hypothetical protein
MVFNDRFEDQGINTIYFVENMGSNISNLNLFSILGLLIHLFHKAALKYYK